MNAIASAAPYVLPLMGAAGATALIIQILIKPLLNLVIAPANPNQNAIVRAAVYVVALLVVLASQFLHYQLNSRGDIAAALGAAFVVAGLAITSFHVLTSNDLPALPVPLAAVQGTPPAPRLPTPKVGSDSPAVGVPAVPATSSGITPSPLPNVVTPTTS